MVSLGRKMCPKQASSTWLARDCVSTQSRKLRRWCAEALGIRSLDHPRHRGNLSCLGLVLEATHASLRSRCEAFTQVSSKVALVIDTGELHRIWSNQGERVSD